MSQWRVRIGDIDAVAGAGVFVGRGRVLTCAHIVNQLLGRSDNARDRPQESIPVDFPSLRGSATTGRVLPGGWCPVEEDGSGDVAMLTLAEPIVAEPAHLGPVVRRGTEVYVYGHPPGYDLGVEAQAVLAGPGGPGSEWVQLESARATGFRVQGGFSGAGVVDVETGLVIGLLVSVANDAAAKVAWMLPTAGIVGRFPEIASSVAEIQRGTASVNTLPPPVSHFAGRDAELNSLLNAVKEGAGQLLVHAVTGMPGIGKTALALHLAYALTSRFPDAQLYIDLQGHSEEDAVASDTALARLLGTLGVVPNPQPSTTAEWAEVWRAELANRRVVVVLDNADSARQVRPLLPGASPSLVLLTSRRRLLELDHAEELVLAGLRDQDAQQLLESMVGSERVQAEPEAIADLIRLCGQLPLALRLVAAGLRAHPERPIASMVSAVRVERGLLERPHLGQDISVRAAFTLSYRRLGDAEKTLCRRLGLHPTSEFGTHAAAATAGVDLRTARYILDRLYTDNLVQEIGWDRYRLHDLMRDYLRERAEDEETPEQRRLAVIRSLDYYLHAALSAHAALLPFRAIDDHVQHEPAHLPRLDDPDAAGVWFSTELANLVACVAIAKDYNLRSHVWRLPRAISQYLRQVGDVKDAVRVLIPGMAAATEDGDQIGIAAMRTSLGDLNYARGQMNDAVAEFEFAAALAERLGARIALADLENRIGRVLCVLGKREEARLRHEQALRAFTELGDRYGQAETHYFLGLYHRLVASYGEAVSHQEEAVRGYRELGYPPGEAKGTEAIGILHRLRGDYRAAVECFDTALSIFQRGGDRRWVAHTLNNTASSLLLLGDAEQAKERVDEALATFRSVGNRVGESDALVVSGRVHRALRWYERSVADLRRSLDLSTVLGTPGGQANASLELAKTLRAMEVATDAAAASEQALRVYREIGSVRGVALAELELARCLHAAGSPDAGAHCELALRACEENGLPEAELARELLAMING